LARGRTASPPATIAENPPEPGAAEVEEQAAPEPITLTPENVRELGSKFVALAARDMLNLQIWLSHGRPVALEGDTLVLEFNADQSNARKILEKPENRRLIEESFEALGGNVKTFRTQQCEAIPTPANGDDRQARLPFAGHVTEAQAREALEEPGVAKVVEVFRGRIVDIVREVLPEE
jgi:hypothetical protein